MNYFQHYPASTQCCINVEIWLNIGHDVVQPHFNVDTTSQLQRWITVDISTLNQSEIWSKLQPHINVEITLSVQLSNTTIFQHWCMTVVSTLIHHCCAGWVHARMKCKCR